MVISVRRDCPRLLEIKVLRVVLSVCKEENTMLFKSSSEVQAGHSIQVLGSARSTSWTGLTLPASAIRSDPSTWRLPG